MIFSRRRFMVMGGGVLATFSLPMLSRANPVEVIEMRGTPRGGRVWFMPKGLAVSTGTTLRFVNKDPGNSHTATAYHPDHFGRQRRIPRDAEPWHSGFLLPDDHFEVTLNVPGVYDYYCVPHERAGMVGRIVVGNPDDADWQEASSNRNDIAPVALKALPPVAAILEHGRVAQDDEE